MRTKILAISLVSSLSLGTAVAAPAPAVGATRAATPVVPPAQSTTPAPGNPIQTPSQQVNPNFQSSVSTNPYTATNQFQATPTNEMTMTPTNGFPGNTNMAAGGTNQFHNNVLIRDQAITSNDRILLGALQQGLASQLGITSPNAMPVHFLINNGAVTLVGLVPTADESQRILARVRQTPGVVSVFNDLHVGTAPTAVQPRNNLTGGAGITDRAFTPADQTLLSVVQQSVGSKLGLTGASAAQMPVHFSIENGVVGVTGQLSSPQEKATVLAAVQQTPGVVRVVDNVALINVPQNSAVPGTSPLQTPQMNNQNNQPLSPTSRTMGLTNNNSSGF